MKAYKHSIILIMLLLSCMSIPAAVTAIYFEHEYADTISGTEEYSITITAYMNTQNNNLFYITNSKEYYSGLKYLSHQVSAVGFYRPISGGAAIYAGDNIPVLLYADAARTVLIGRALYSWDTNYNALGNPISTDTWVHFEEFDSQLISGSTIYFDTEDPLKFFRFTSIPTGNMGNAGSNPSLGNIYLTAQNSYASGEYVTVYQGSVWVNQLSGTHTEDQISHLDLTRNGYRSNFTVWYGDHIYIQDNSVNDISRDFPSQYYTYKIVSTYGTEYTEIFKPVSDEPETVSILASVKNIQDYSVIGDSTISFVSDTENITRTMPNGYDLFTLAENTWYNVSASADGYTPQLAYEPNLWTGSSAIDVWMIPTSEESNETVQMNWYVSESNSASSGNIRLKQAIITLNGGEKTLITDNNGYASTVLNRTGSISYIIQKDGYVTYSRSFTPNWETYTHPTIDEHIQLLRIGEPIGGVTPAPTPDRRTNIQKVDSALSIIFSNIEVFAGLCSIVLLFSYLGWMSDAVGGKRRRR